MASQETVEHVDLNLSVPTTEGGLRLQLGLDDSEKKPRLVVRGFYGHCLAESVVVVGDEIIVVNGVHVEGQQVRSVLSAILSVELPNVDMVIRRRVSEHTRHIQSQSVLIVMKLKNY